MNEKHHVMTESPIVPLILRLAVPNTLGLLVVSAYSLADSFFVASLGEEASAAVGLTFSLHVLMQAVGYTLGMGAGTLLSRALGRGEEKDAAAYASVATVLALLIGVFITATGLFLRAPLLRFLGASEALLPTALAYVTPLLWSAPAMCTSFVLSQLLRANGRAVASMVGLAVGSLLNIALDPLLISALGLGVSGASVATLISQHVGLFVLLCAFRKRGLHFSVLEGFSVRRLFLGWKILVAGLPSLFRQGLSGIAAILLNRVAADIGGDTTVTALSLVARIFLLVFSLCLGIGQGMLPVVGYNEGAGNPERMKKAYLFSMIVASTVMLLISIPLFFLSTQILSLFSGDERTLSLGAFALRAQSSVLVTHGAVTCTILFLQAVGRPVLGTVLAAARQGLLFLPLIALLPRLWGVTGLSLTQPIADALTFLFALPFVLAAWNYLKKSAATDIFTKKA